MKNQRLSKHPTEILVIKNEHEIEGFIGFGAARDSDLYAHSAEIYTLYFDSKYYGNGHAKQLMNEVLKLLKQQNYRHVVLWVFTENKRARTFYEKIGFKQITAEKRYHEQTPEIRLCLPLD